MLNPMVVLSIGIPIMMEKSFHPTSLITVRMIMVVLSFGKVITEQSLHPTLLITLLYMPVLSVGES